MSAASALIEMAAECGGATPCNGQQHFDMLPGDPLTASFDEGVSRARTRSATSRGGRSIYSSCGDLSFSFSESRGLAVALR
jgi:hypothetical protein